MVYIILVHFFTIFICPHVAHQISNMRKVAVIKAYFLSPNFMVLPSSSKTNFLAQSLPPLPLSQACRYPNTLCCFKISEVKRE